MHNPSYREKYAEFLKIEFPKNWTDAEKYDFDWSILKNETIRFQKFDFNTI